MRSVAVLFLLSAVAAHAPAVAITFDDGQLHVIDAANSYPFESVTVDDGIGPTTTTVVIESGGQVGSPGIGGAVYTYGSSVLNVLDGTVECCIRAYDTSVISVHGGTSDYLETNDDSIGTLTGGTIEGQVRINNAAFNMSGGLATREIYATGTAIVNVSGGDVIDDIRSFDTSEVTVSGGTVGGHAVGGHLVSLQALGGGRFWITGGTFQFGVRLQQDSSVDISGGSFSTSSTFAALGDSTIRIVGSSFNLPFGDISESSGTLTGVLSNGTPISILFNRASTATITLVTQEDPDGDGISSDIDNCPDIANPQQEDGDSDGVGDVCDPFPNDPCHFIGFLPRSTPILAAFQDNNCEDWSGVSQPGDDLQSAVLSEADLSLADLNGTVLADATFLGASLDGASLFNVNLSNANLDSAILTSADLTFADLSSADLSNADLTASDLTSATLPGALYDEFTIFPSGSTYNNPPWGLPGDAAPWSLGMLPVPEPASGLMLAVGGLALAAIGRRR